MPAVITPPPRRRGRPIRAGNGTRLPAVRDTAERNALALTALDLVDILLAVLAGHHPAVRRYRDDCRGAAYLTLLRAAELWKDHGGTFRTYVRASIRPAILAEALRLHQLHTLCFTDASRDGLPPFDPASADRPEPFDPDAVRIAEGLALLEPYQQEVIALRLGLDGGPRRTREEVALALGWTLQRVRGVETWAVQRIAYRRGASWGRRRQ